MGNKDKVKGFTFGVVVTSVVLGTTSAFAGPIQNTVTAVMKDFNIYVDNEKINVTDAKGKPTAPLIYNDTTYLPIRSIATSLKQPVEWDAKTNSIRIGQKETGSDADSLLIEKSVELASLGKTMNSEEFGIGSQMSDIIEKWGKPDEPSDEQYVYYNERHINFIGKSGKVEQIYSQDEKLWKITLPKVREALGKPVKEVKGEDAYVLHYPAGDRTIEFGFYYNDNMDNATVKFISVY